MASLDDDIDRLYQGPLDAFTDARNALAKAAKRPELKKLEKPNLAAWAVNQLHWHHRPVLDELGAAAAALLEQHHRALAGEAAEIHAAAQTHRDLVRRALAAAKELLRAAGQPDTAATLEAIRTTLEALPAPEAQGRLTRPLAPRGLEALAGLVVARTPAPSGQDEARERGATTRQREAERFGLRARDERERARERERAQREAEAHQAAREHEMRRAAAAAALAEAEATLARAVDAEREAEQNLARCQAERYAAQQAVARARQAVRDVPDVPDVP